MAGYKRGVFYMNFTVNGEGVFKSAGKFTKKEAEQGEALERHKLMNEQALLRRNERQECHCSMQFYTGY